jgi:hypothetical protein
MGCRWEQKKGTAHRSETKLAGYENLLEENGGLAPSENATLTARI